MNKLLIVGTVAFDAIETPFGKTDKILGGAGGTGAHLISYDFNKYLLTTYHNLSLSFGKGRG